MKKKLVVVFPLRQFIRYVILCVERGKTREAAYPEHYNINLL